MERPAVYKIESSGVVKHETKSASATTSASFSKMKYTATSTGPSTCSVLCLTKLSATNRPAAMATVFTVKVSTRPPNFPSKNSHLRTGLASSAYNVRLSISFHTKPTPINPATNNPTTAIPLNPTPTITPPPMTMQPSP